MLIIVVIIINLFLIQLVSNLYAKLTSRKIERRYAYTLDNTIEAAEVVENYIKIFRQVNLSVNANIMPPAFAYDTDYVLLNRIKMYESDLYTNFYTIYQLELTKDKFNFARRIYVVQNILFFFQIVSFILGIVLQDSLNDIFLILSLIFTVANILVSIFGYFIYNSVLNSSLEIAKDLLNLEELEIVRTENLKNELRLVVFEYPIEFLKRVFLFFIP
jgi:hypothetical protein